LIVHAKANAIVIAEIELGKIAVMLDQPPAFADALDAFLK